LPFAEGTVVAFAFFWALFVGFIAALWARSGTRALERRVKELEEGLGSAHRRIEALSSKLSRLAANARPEPDATARDDAHAPDTGTAQRAPGSVAVPAADSVRDDARTSAAAPRSIAELPRDAASAPTGVATTAPTGGVTPARAAASPAAPKPSRSPVSPDTPAEPGFSIVALLRRNPFATAGIGLLLLGFAYFFQSIEWGRLISPSARIGLAWLASGVLAAVGARVSARHPLWGQLVQGGAAAVAYLATYVALAVFALLSPTVAFALFAAISALLVWRALREDSKVLAAVGFLGAYAAPLLAMQGSAPLGLTLSYGLLITSVALGIALLRGWLELAVYAHLCAAGLAAATWAGEHAPLPTPVQQLLVNAYGLQFVAFCVAWARRRDPDERAAAVLGICLTIAVVVYLALQYWLLDQRAFAAVALATGIGLIALATRLGGAPFLRESAFVLGALAIASAFTQQSFGRTLTGFLLYAEGVLIVLTAGQDARVRAWLGRGLVVLGMLVLVEESGAWWWLLLPASISYALSLRARGAVEDSVLHAAVVVVAVTKLTAELVDGPSLRAPMLLVATVLLAAGAWLWRGRAAKIVYGVAAAAAGAAFLVVPAGPHLALHAVVLLVTVAGAVLALWRTTRADSDGARYASAARSVTAVVLLLPALLAWKAEAALPWLVGWTALALAAYALLEQRGVVRATWRLADDPRVSHYVPYAAAAGALLGLAVFLPLESVPRSRLLFGGVAFLVTAAAWAFVGPERTRGPRRVLGSTALAYGGALWLIALGSSPAEAWRTALASGPICVLLAVAGVANLFVSSRSGDRRGWQVAAAICVLATVLLLSLLGSALTSPLGIAGSLLALGALFLLAGYLAPQPPARGEERDAPAG
jgi:hypothetical protein